jgi:N-acetylglucosaminyl-diphospho-decaprenol L-rhamnosyltransferase
MDLSVVIVNWNVQELLAACLASVYASLEDTGIAFEVVVVDNASDDGSAAMVRERFPQARLLANADNRGYAGGSNEGLALTTGRHVLVLNPDTVVRGNALGALVRFMDETPAAGMAGPRLVYPDGRFQHSAFGFPTLAQLLLDFFPLHARLLESRLNGRYPRSWYAAGRPFPVDHPLGACMMVRREALERVGGMDESYFMYCEELDWAMRLKRAGWGVYCVPAAELVHHAGQSTRQVRAGMFVALWRSRFRFFARYYSALFNRAVRWVVRLGLGAEERRARRQAAAGQLTAQELATRLEMYAQVRGLRLTNGEEH